MALFTHGNWNRGANKIKKLRSLFDFNLVIHISSLFLYCVCHIHYTPRNEFSIIFTFRITIFRIYHFLNHVFWAQA